MKNKKDTRALQVAEQTWKNKKYIEFLYSTGLKTTIQDISVPPGGGTYTIPLTADTTNSIIVFDDAADTTVTIDAGLSIGCSFYNKGAGLVTFVYGTGVGTFPDGTILTQDSICSLLVITGDYRLKGELI